MGIGRTSAAGTQSAGGHMSADDGVKKVQVPVRGKPVLHLTQADIYQIGTVKKEHDDSFPTGQDRSGKTKDPYNNTHNDEHNNIDNIFS